MGSIVLVGVLGAVISAVIGTLWYSNSTPMGKWHMQYLGFDKLSDEEKAKKMAEGKSKMAVLYGGQMFLSLLTSLFIGFVTYTTVQNGGPANAVYYYIIGIWVGFVAPLVGQSLLWSNCERSLAWKKFFSDSLNNLVTFLAIGFVATLLV